MRTKLSIAIFLALATIALLIVGCGEKEEPSTAGPVVTQTTTGQTTTTQTTTGGGGAPSDDQEIRAVVTDYLTKADAPGACTKLVTPQFVRRSYGNTKGCEAARKPSAMATSVAIQPAPGGNGSTVTAKPKGGVFGGERLEVTLINLEGQWTIDRITSNAKVGP